MIHVQAIDTLAQRLAALVPPGLQEARADLTANFRSALQSGLRELDLVTREEFDVQRCVLLRTREKIEELEQQVLALERTLAANAAPKHCRCTGVAGAGEPDASHLPAPWRRRACSPPARRPLAWNATERVSRDARCPP